MTELDSPFASKMATQSYLNCDQSKLKGKREKCTGGEDETHSPGGRVRLWCFYNSLSSQLSELFVACWRNWIAHLTTDQEVRGSSATKKKARTSAVGREKSSWRRTTNLFCPKKESQTGEGEQRETYFGTSAVGREKSSWRRTAETYFGTQPTLEQVTVARTNSVPMISKSTFVF